LWHNGEVIKITEGKETGMEKFRFESELKEAVLTYENGQAYVTVNGEKRRVRSPVPLKMDRIGENGIACLILEGTDSGGTGDRIVAVLFDDIRKEGKDWIGISPMLMEQAVGYFLEHHKMEKMVSGYKSVVREKGSDSFRADFTLDDVCTIEVRVPSVGMADACGSYVRLMPMAKSLESFLKGIAGISDAQGKIQKIIFLFLLPYKGDGSLQLALNERVRQAVEGISGKGIRVEFWSAEMGIDQCGISLLSYQEITDLVLGQ